MKKHNFQTPEFKGFLTDYINLIEGKSVIEKYFGHFTKGAPTLFAHPHPPIAFMIMEVNQNETTTKQPS